MQTILISILTAAITTKIIATYYFKKIDGYVEKMCEMTLKSNEKTVAILHKLQENFELEDWRLKRRENAEKRHITDTGFAHLV